jgi:hypothetical protein
LRVWCLDPGFATFSCARCAEHGHVRDTSTTHRPIDRDALDCARAEAAERDRASAAERLALAQRLWARRRPIAGTIAERYLRKARAVALARWPATLGFLPASDRYPPAMIAAFGIAREPEPGATAIGDDAVRGAHLTRLLPDGRDRAKIMIGRSAGWPIVLAPPNDLLGLAVAEGIEDTLTVHYATGLGAWAAGAASRMPALAGAVPSYIDCVTIIMDDDPAGQRGALGLASALRSRKFEVLVEGWVP